MSDAKIVNIARLMTTYTFAIEELPDNLKCAQCKSVLKDACQVPCGCRFCRACIDDMMARGVELCPGTAEDCAGSLLFLFSSDYRANRKISRLTVKCPRDGCVHECPLACMEEHLRECRKSGECPFRELGCTWDKFATENVDEHLQQKNRRHTDILIGTVVNSIGEIEMLKRDLVLKGWQIRTIINQMVQVANGNNSIKSGNESIKKQEERLPERVTTVTHERRENDELDSVTREIGHGDSDVAAISGLIGSNLDDPVIDANSTTDNIRLVSGGGQSTTHDICGEEPQMQLIHSLLEQVDARCEWMIDTDVSKHCWHWGDRMGDFFTGSARPHKYQLDSANVKGTAGELYFLLLIFRDSTDEKFAWPFEGRLFVTVTDKHRHHVCSTITRQFRVETPPKNECRRVDSVIFRHSELVAAGLNLRAGVRVSCGIVLGDW